MVLRVLDLGKGRALGHHDGRRDAQPSRMIGDALGMVARRHGDDAAGPLGLGQAEQLVQRPALLEGGGELQILELQPDLAAGDGRERARLPHRRAHHLSGDRRGGLFDIFQ